ncbi:Chaperone of endosialidase [Gracilibacillus orientalis]|uniref:Chaperone of endosialidase n=1 Tax=Gracilibacillus orientalis TaxID=334253 RepID=A0A1I4Q897_9BACI|nr:tail fiber domain-containing protein [Gracilibacillus orientalis]SFM36274.1 Chaperone of endosialidase [Gracilibacillus orientalis]
MLSNLIHLDGLTLIENGVIQNAHIENGTIERAKLVRAVIGEAQIEDLAVTNAKIASLNADKINASRLSAITANMGTVTAGRLLSNNNAIDINLNTSQFKLGSNAKIHFTDRANTLYYTNNSVYGGLLFDHSLNGGGRPLVALGVSDNGFDPNDTSWNGLRVHSGWVESNVDGVMTNIISQQFWTNQNPDYSGEGWVLENAWSGNRNRAIYGMDGENFGYDLGFAGGGEFSNGYIENVNTNRVNGFDEILFRNRYDDSNVGWTLKLAYEGGSTVDFYPINTGTPNYYNIGRSNNRINRAYLNIVEGNSIGTSSNPHSYVYTDYLIEGSDESIKDNVQDSQLGLNFVKDIHVVDFKMKSSEKYKSGVIAQELVSVLDAHDVNLD